MSDDLRPHDPCVIWKQQPEEDAPVIIDHILNRRTQQLQESTRWEIIMSMLAAVFFVGVLAWRLPPVGFALQPIGLAGAALWIVTTAIRFRSLIWGRSSPLNAAMSGSAFYRRALEMRRDHLRNTWLWHGPLLLASVLFVASFAGHSFPGRNQFRNAAPLFLILGLWIVIGVWRRFRQAAALQREIDEVARLEKR